MSKYTLVGYKYNISYDLCSNEKEIKLDNKTLSGFLKIDKFMSGKNYFEVWEELAKYNDLSDINNFAIKYTKKDDETGYLPIFIDNKILYGAVKDCSSVKLNYVGEGYDYYILCDNKEFCQFYKLFSKAIKSYVRVPNYNNKKWLSDLIGNNYKLKEYINNSFDGVKNYKDYCVPVVVEEEFSRYRTFREVMRAYCSLVSDSFELYSGSVDSLNEGRYVDKETEEYIEKIIRANKLNAEYDDSYYYDELVKYGILEDYKEKSNNNKLGTKNKPKIRRRKKEN